MSGVLSPSVGRWLLLGTAVAQALAPVVVGFGEGDEGGSGTVVVVPSGPFFAVWGVVIIGSLAVAITGLPRSRAAGSVYRRVQLPLSLVQVGFVVWLVAAAQAPPLTVPVFAVMVALLAPTLVAVLRQPATPLTRAVVGGLLGVYTGWSAAAVWINAVTQVPTDLVERPVTGEAVQVVAVAGAAVTAVVITILTRAWVPYVATAGWALVGVLLAGAAGGSTPVVAAAASGLAAVAATVVVTRLGRRGRLNLEPGRP